MRPTLNIVSKTFLSCLAGLLLPTLTLASGDEAAPAASTNTSPPAAAPASKPYGGPVSAWADIEAKVATQPPGPDTAEKKYLKMRISAKAYYEQYKGWSAPVPPALPDGVLRNLSDVPSQPRFALAGKDWPQKPGEASVCLWEDDKVAAMSFLLWGGLPGSLAGAEELIKTKYPAARFSSSLIPGYTEHPSLHPGVNVNQEEPGAWEAQKAAFSQGITFLSQSITWDVDPVYEDGWPGPEWECAESIHLLDTKIPGQRTRVFLFPGGYMGQFNVGKTWRPVVTQYFCAAIGRLGGGINTANQVDYFNIAGVASKTDPTIDNDPNPTEGSFYNVLNSDPANPFYKFYRGWIIPNAHIFSANTTTDPLSIPMGKALDFFQRHESDIWSGTVDAVALYGEERDTATVETTESSDSKITLTVKSKLDPANFDYPLTVKVRLPAAWKTITATQGGKPIPAQIIQHEGNAFGLVKIVPNQGAATIQSK
jgi:hypothetical protein